MFRIHLFLALNILVLPEVLNAEGGEESCNLLLQNPHFIRQEVSSPTVVSGGVMRLPQNQIRFHPTIFQKKLNDLVSKVYGSLTHVEQRVREFAVDVHRRTTLIDYGNGVRVKFGIGRFLYVVDDIVVTYEENLVRELRGLFVERGELPRILMERMSTQRAVDPLLTPLSFWSESQIIKHRKHYASFDVKTDQEYQQLANRAVRSASQEGWQGLVWTRKLEDGSRADLVTVLDLKENTFTVYEIYPDGRNRLITHYKLNSRASVLNLILRMNGYQYGMSRVRR